MSHPVPVIFLPGLMQDARIFAPQVDGLSHDRATMVVPTHHADNIEEIADFVLASAPRRFACVGTSLGGAVALEVLQRDPDRVDRICLISTAAMSETPDVVAHRDVQIASVKGGRFDDVVDDALGLDGLAETPFRLEIGGMARDMARSLGPDVFLRQSEALKRRKDQQSTLRKIKCPTMVLCGEGDKLYPVKRHEFMAEMIPRATLEVVGQASHMVTLEQPGAVNAALRGWLT